jgi:hypothetical protein
MTILSISIVAGVLTALAGIAAAAQAAKPKRALVPARTRPRYRVPLALLLSALMLPLAGYALGVPPA